MLDKKTRPTGAHCEEYFGAVPMSSDHSWPTDTRRNIPTGECEKCGAPFWDYVRRMHAAYSAMSSEAKFPDLAANLAHLRLETDRRAAIRMLRDASIGRISAEDWNRAAKILGFQD